MIAFYGVTPARCDFLHEMFDIPREKIHLLPLGADDDEMHFEDKGKIREEGEDREEKEVGL